jgi:PadR family transcriptional regulator, regulatory protein AphA
LSTTELTPFACEVLALVGRDGAGAHDLLRMARRSRFYAVAGESQYYTEPKRLAGLGYLAARSEPGKTRDRTVYTLTDKGLEALRAWVRTPARSPRLQHEGAIRVLAADLVGHAAVREGLQTLRDDIAEVEAQLDEAEERADALPHRRRYLMLNHRLARRLVAAHLEWLDEVERELAGPDTEPVEHSSVDDATAPR